ncbi:hexosaminidase D isoform X2 [Halyomorpha halys]|nr:hexosaminidase D-like isoform X2 [Halyomorpha halys]XP_014288133.1 hexosaminidase D-like isoform X2 [Halyomorpha halys]
MVRGLRVKVIIIFGVTLIVFLWLISIQSMESWRKANLKQLSLYQLPVAESPYTELTFPKKDQNKGQKNKNCDCKHHEYRFEIPIPRGGYINYADLNQEPFYFEEGLSEPKKKETGKGVVVTYAGQHEENDYDMTDPTPNPKNAKSKSNWQGLVEKLSGKNKTGDESDLNKLKDLQFLEFEGEILSNSEFKRRYPNFQLRGVTEDTLRVFHLDLKGAPPNLDYLRRLLPLLAASGCDTLLIEYEDMFPYWDSLVNISAKNAYKRQDIRKLLSWTHDLGMQVIPLIQTFGHMEHVLKLNDWKHLRELPDFPSDLCPSNPGSILLVEEMITQVVMMHPGIKFIHIGGDEVIHVGACGSCSGTNPWVLYSKHITAVAEIIQRKYPGMTPIIWDDMMRPWSPEFHARNPFKNVVEVMVWDYVDVNNLITPQLWFWYMNNFKRIWVASAFKGADLPTADLPNLEIRYHNTKSWLKKVDTAEIPIAGFVLTGWSRYDHFAVLCELLPPSVPSLLLNMITISKKHSSSTEEKKLSAWKEALKCPSPSFTLESLREDQSILTKCDYPGAEVYGIVLHYLILKAKTDTLYDSMTKNKAWLTPYNVNHNFSNIWRIVQDYTYLKTYTLLLDIRKFDRESKSVLVKYFDRHTAKEWLEQKVTPLDKKLQSIGDSVEKLLNISIWPRRPIF